ncbi:hypothetical protein GWK48_08460 [Metallosphaera tengchongensis]|uniref:DUF86 domain-containing protein n=1 Tax=Metallosphaera tengchongensis TaxID=1532350 RepID=A0A6N0NZ96_9CREN|nr:hypothetical protein [Metallosphaera tengchongensis]QKR00400.1 hypothetical protein GWK48_08460 [Metallosphaera tengchongensis]
MEFREYYSILEYASRLREEEFLKDDDLKSKVREVINDMLNLIFKLASNLVEGRGEDLIWNLVKGGVIQAPLAQELLDIVKLTKSSPDDLLYASLVRVMEDIEEAYHTIKSRINNS